MFCPAPDPVSSPPAVKLPDVERAPGATRRDRGRHRTGQAADAWHWPAIWGGNLTHLLKFGGLTGSVARQQQKPDQILCGF